MVKWAALTLSLLLACVLPSCFCGSVDEGVMQRIQDKIWETQYTKDQELIPFQQWEQREGLLEIYLMFSFHGNPLFAELRRKLVAPDTVPTSITPMYDLVQLPRYKGAPIPPDSRLAAMIKAREDFQIHEYGNGSAFLSYWPQEYNEETGKYNCKPRNLLFFINSLTANPDMTEKVAKLADYFGVNEIPSQISTSSEGFSIKSFFNIPPDFDDSNLHLSILYQLKQFQDVFPKAWNEFYTLSSDYATFIEDMKNINYQPFSSDPNLNAIDSRSYYWARDFIDEAYASGNDVVLQVIWRQTPEEDRRREELKEHVKIPYNVNIMDVGGFANMLLVFSQFILSGEVPADVLDDPTLLKLYHNSTALLVQQVNGNFSGRPEIVSPYYQKSAVFWFLTRCYELLHSALAKGPLPRPVMDVVHDMVESCAKGAVTRTVLSTVDTDGHGLYYWDDVLGTDDVTWTGEKINRAEDRIFTTGYMVKTLLYTWTTCDDSSRTCSWMPDVPGEVKSVVKGAVKWLEIFTLSGAYELWGVVASVSVKGDGTIPYIYPANQVEFFINGSTIEDTSHYPEAQTVVDMKGYVDRAEYDRMLEQDHFGYRTPRTFHGYNSDSSFLFWSADSATLAAALVSMTRYNSIEEP